MANKGFDVADNFNQNLFWNDFKKGIKQAAQVGRTVADTAGNIWQQVDPNSYGQVSQYHQMANKGFDVADNFNQNLFWNDIKKFANQVGNVGKVVVDTTGNVWQQVDPNSYNQFGKDSLNMSNKIFDAASNLKDQQNLQVMLIWEGL